MKSRKNESRFPASIFVVYLIVLLAMSGVHTGLLVLMGNLGWSDTVQIAVPLLYWGLIAVGLTLFTRWRIRRTYDIPVQKLAQAARQVDALCALDGLEARVADQKAVLESYQPDEVSKLDSAIVEQRGNSVLLAVAADAEKARAALDGLE